jgi:hypothetical protein
MINYDDIEEGKTIITGIGMSGKEVTGVCTNVMCGFRMVSVKYGSDRLQKDIIEYNNITEIKDIE